MKEDKILDIRTAQQMDVVTFIIFTSERQETKTLITDLDHATALILKEGHII